MEMIFDPTISSNLINCGLWRTASTSMALGGNFRDQWLQPFNVETFRSIGFDFPQVNYSDTANHDDAPDWAECFGQLWALVHPNQPTFYQTTDATSIPTVCDSELIFGRQNWYIRFPSCINQLCDSKGWLNPDLGGIGVSSPSKVVWIS